MPEGNVKDHLVVRTRGSFKVSRHLAHNNLKAIVAVGYRVY